MRGTSQLWPFVLCAMALTGCAAVATGIQYKDLQVQTKVSDSVFLDPVSPDKRTVWLDIRNTSGQEIDLSSLSSQIAVKGYRVVADPNEAQLRLQVNVLYLGRAELAAVNRWIAAGYGGVFAGTTIGAAAGTSIGQSVPAGLWGAGIGGILGGLAETAINAAVKAVTYTVVTDFQLSERLPAPLTVQTSEQRATGLPEGRQQDSASRQFTETLQWKQHRVRVASIATKVNLDFAEAKPVLTQDLLRSLAGLF